MGVANSNSVHVDIIESGLLHTTLQHQCLSTPSRKVVREIEIDIAIQYPLRLVFVRSDLQLLVGHVSSILHHVLFEEELLLSQWSADVSFSPAHTAADNTLVVLG